MRRSATEIIRSLENRVAYLEGKEARTSNQITGQLTGDKGKSSYIPSTVAVAKIIKLYGFDEAIIRKDINYILFRKKGTDGRVNLEVYTQDSLIDHTLRILGGLNLEIKRQN